jgi:hypothetical protein
LDDRPSFCAMPMAPTSLAMASSSGTMPAASVHRLISKPTCSIGLFAWIFDQGAFGKPRGRAADVFFHR